MKTRILNSGGGAWAFEAHAQHLARVMNLQIRDSPADFNYVLGWDAARDPDGASFIPLEAMRLASDKRVLAEVFARNGVATPTTHLLDSSAEIEAVLASDTASQWVLKWPTGCGGAGHRIQSAGMPIPTAWPRPYVLQEFIPLETPEVYRVYAVGGELFGWNARRFAPGGKSSPFVAHARGARYEDADQMPREAELQARAALSATGLLSSFGCADLMRDATGNWLVLEINTDGVFNHVDREVSLGSIADEIDGRLVAAFWKWVES